MADTKKAALDLVRRGFRVFRVRYGTKDHFVDKDWAHGGASDDALEVAGKWSAGEFNPCILATGLAILDVDKRAKVDGFKSLAALGGELPDTFTTETPSIGEHYFFDAQGIEFGQVDLAPGINIRATNGYVVGPGGYYDGFKDGKDYRGHYTIKRDVPVAPLPAWLAEKLKAVAQRTGAKGAVVGDLDTDSAVGRVIQYLTTTAKPAVQGDGGDNTTYKVALHVLDFGVSEETAVELMLEHYNERCSPPWDLEGIKAKVDHAAKYRKAAIGRANVTVGFKPVPPPPAPAAPQSPFAPCSLDTDEKDLPVREWMLKRKLIIGYATALVAPGGAGKSTLTLPWATAIATNDGEFFGGLEVLRSGNVLIVNKEDDKAENELRIYAMLKHFKKPRSALKGKLHLLRDIDAPFAVARRLQNRLLVAPDVDETVAYMLANNIRLLVVDPLVETHEANESDNTEMAIVMGAYRTIARKARAAVLVVHHSSKPPQGDSSGHVGNMHAGRGASAIAYAVRIALTLFNMSEKESGEYQLSRPRHYYVRLDDAKANLHLASPHAEWFERIGVQLENGEEVGVLAPVVLLKRTETDNKEVLQELVKVCGVGYRDTIGAAAKKLEAAAIPILNGRKKDYLAKRIRAHFDGLSEKRIDIHGARVHLDPGNTAAGGMLWIEAPATTDILGDL